MNPEPARGDVPARGDARNAPLLGPLQRVVEGEARRVLSDAQIAPDPERIAQGWERRFVADESRVPEMVQLYRELGYETVVDPLRAADVLEDCGDCRLVALQRLKMIYTRPPRGAHGASAPGRLDVHPIDRLLEEHRDIMAEIASLRAAVASLKARGDAALPAALPALRSAGRMMETRLLQHALREDEGLFPAVERALGTADAPTAVMREEHRAIHADAARFREIVRELNEVEHPAIETGGATLRRLVEGGGSAAALAETGEEIIRLLDLHFEKEESVLFPMARSVLSDREMDDVGRAMDAMDANARRVTP